MVNHSTKCLICIVEEFIMNKEHTTEDKLDCILSLEEKRSLSQNDWSIIRNYIVDKDSELRYRAAGLLALFPSDESEQLLVPLLNDDDHLVRATACDSLSFSKSNNTLNLLLKVVKDKQYLVRGYAILSIGDIQNNIGSDNTEVIKLLKYLYAKESSEWVKIAISRSLYILGEFSYGNLLLEKLNNRSYRNRCFVLSLLEQLIDNNNAYNMPNVFLSLNQRLEVEEADSVKIKLESLITKISNASGSI